MMKQNERTHNNPSRPHWLKKRFIVVLAAVMLFGSVFASCGGNQPEVYEDGYFQYCIVEFEGKSNRYEDGSHFGLKKGDQVIAIVGLTESGQEQEVIEFPSTLAGKRVAYLGWGWNTGTFSCMAGRGESFFYIESSNLKKTYIPESIYGIAQGAFYEINNISLIFYSTVLPKINTSSLSFTNTPYVCDKSKINLGGSYNANIAFMNNYSDEVNGGYYRIDNIEIDELIPVPPSPERDGYHFTGWFTEPDCANTWDFDTAPFVDTEETARLSLYAGWINK